MKKIVAKELRNSAERQTVGESVSNTRRLYRQIKRNWELFNNFYPTVKVQVSKRQKRLSNA